MRHGTPIEVVRRAASGLRRTERRGLLVLAALGVAVSLFVLGLSFGRLIGGDVAGAAAGAPALILLGMGLVAACGLTDAAVGD